MARALAPLIEARALSASRGGRLVLTEIAFSAGAGDWFGVLGVNGSGKTTLLQCLAGRLPAEDGALLIDGEDVAGRDRARAAAVGFAPAPESLPALLTVGELIGLAARMRRAPPGEPAAVQAALRLAQLSREPVERLSMGERQRVAIALAFLGAPRIVVLDEPFNWLDPVAAYDLKTVLSDLVGDGLLLVTALHDLATFTQRCTAGLWLHDGLVAQGLDANDLAAARADPAAFERRIFELFRKDASP